MSERIPSESRSRTLAPTLMDDATLSRRARILDAMIASCAEKSYPATTIADIVSRAGISRTTFYRHFTGKPECFDAALDACIERMATAGAPIDGDDSPPAVVRKAAGAMLRLLAVKPALALMVTGEFVSIAPAAIDRHRKRLIQAVEGLWTAGGASLTHRSDPQLAIGRAQVLIFDQIAAGRAEQLPELLPEIVYIALLPFAGHDEALTEAQLARDIASADNG